MCVFTLKIIFLVALIQHCLIANSDALQQNKTVHHVRRSSEDSFFKTQKSSYRSFQPVSIKYHNKNSYPRADDRADYDITSYDTEYGGVVSNFTSSIYDDNPPLYPNPEFVSHSNQVNKIENKAVETDVEIPDDSLADADLKEHNIIDSMTYLYGFNSCHVRNEWMILIFITCGIAMLLVLAAMMWLMWSEPAAEFRRGSKLYPIIINLCCCLAACTLIYVQAVMGVSSPSQCERIALLLHYTYLSCAMWIVALAAAVAEYCACDSLLPLKYNYLLAYGIPAIVVMFNYALSMEHYEIKHYCWMSIEKGMVMGFMVPAMILILINTAIIILGLQSVNKKQAEMLAVKIQELVDHHMAHWPKNEHSENNKNASIDTLDIYTPGSSRKNTDSSDTLDKEYNMSEDDCGYSNINLQTNTVNNETGNDNENNSAAKGNQDKGILNMLYSDNLSWKWSWNTEGNELKSYLHLCLVLEPFFAINWVMGVVAIENAEHWSTPTIYLILVVAMIVCGDLLSLSQPSVSNIVARVSFLLAQKHMDFIKYPQNMTPHRLEFTRLGQYNNYPGLQNIDGAIDCTHVKIVNTPGVQHHEAFRNRKSYFSINVQYVYFTATICITLPIVRNKNNSQPCCEDIVIEPAVTRTRTTDSIPLLDPTIQQPIVTPAPADTISTISI